jgi:hypothetical protein
MKRTLLAATAMAALFLTSLTTPAHAEGVLSATPTTIAGATLDGLTPSASAPPGVSPEVYYDDATGTYYLWTTAIPATLYSSKDGTAWSPVAGATLPNGFDWSIVKMGPNDYRMYFSSINPNAASAVQCSKQRKELRYATSSNLVTWTTQPGVLVDSVGCGVPHVLRKPDGSFLLFYNSEEPQHGIYIATSPDGLTWTKRPGIVADDSELVDPAPLMMPDGTYLMIGSTTGGRTTQQLRILSSPDGLTWTLRQEPLLAPSGVSVLDPALKLIGNQLRVWYGYAPGGDHANSRITSGLLTLKAGKVTTTSSSSSASSSSSSTGKACKKAGAQRKYQGSTYVCKKVKGSLVWVKR